MKNVRQFPLMSDQVDYDEVEIVTNSLNDTLNREVPGDIVEFGCYAGTTSLFIQRILQEQKDGKRAYHVYDSFAGLPDKTVEDDSPLGSQFKAGELHATKQEFIKNFKKANLPLPIIHKAWFDDLDSLDVPEQIAFAFLDGDFYDSIRQSLKLIEDKLAIGSTIIVDDYASESLPGAAMAVDHWLKSRPYLLVQIQHSLAIIRDGRGARR